MSSSEKGFLDIFKRYSPMGDVRALLLRAKDVKVRYTKDPFRVEAELSFDTREDAELIYEIEDECRTLYMAESFKIIPHFPSESFSLSNFDEIAYEAALCGAVTHGFFSNAKYSDDGETITVALPFFSDGIDFVRGANTESILSGILRSRYGISRKVKIIEGEGALEYERMMEQQRAEILKRVEVENAERVREERVAYKKRLEDEAREKDPTYDFEAKAGISGSTGAFEVIDDTTVRIGATTYSFGKSELIYGEDFDVIEPASLADAPNIHKRQIFLGTVFEVTQKETRAGDKTNCTIGISDGASAIYVKKTLPNEELGWVNDLAGAVKKGKKKLLPVAVLGRVQIDKFDNEPFLAPFGIKRISTIERGDNSDEKRVELHLHTNMSQMDAIITPRELVETATRWGHKAIAVTDHGNVQSFPEVMLALEGSGNPDLKILYGTEAYYVNDTARCIFGKTYPQFSDEMIVFDIETTGLSNRTCRIIEIGAVKIKDGEIIDTMDYFVDPECPIP